MNYSKLVLQPQKLLNRSAAAPQPAVVGTFSAADVQLAADLPVFKLGMMGFNQSQRQQIEGIMSALPEQGAVWQVGPFADADGWLLCGDKTRSGPGSSTHAKADTSLRVLAGLPVERALTINLRDVDRPLAFSTPLADPDIEALFIFEPASPQSMHNLLGNFERCLRQVVLQFMLGKQLVDREKELQATVYHVMHGGRLLAVLDFIAKKIGLARDADPQQFKDAIWQKRPIHAHAIPANFLKTDASQLRWTYARHSKRNVLPPRYRRGLIYFKQAPNVALSWVSDSQLRLIQELSHQAASVVSLSERTGMPLEQVSRDLSCLYFAGSLSTVANPVRQPHSGAGLLAQSRSFFSSSIRLDTRPPHEPDTTVAGPLRPW